MSNMYNNFMRQYDKLHSCCPNCGSRNYETTLMGFMTKAAGKPTDFSRGMIAAKENSQNLKKHINKLFISIQ